MSLSTPLVGRFDGPTEILWKQTRTLTCPVYQGGNGTLVEPTVAGSSITIYDDNRTAVVDGAAITVVGDVATYTATGFSSSTPADNWEVVWTLAFASGDTPQVFSNEALLVRRELHPVLTDLDLYRYHRALDPGSNDPITTNANYEAERASAWRFIRNHLRRSGKRPDLMLSPGELMTAHLHLTAEHIYRNAATSTAPVYLEMASSELSKYDAELGRLLVRMDSSNSGEPDADTKPVDPGIWLTAPDKPRYYGARSGTYDPRKGR